MVTARTRWPKHSTTVRGRTRTHRRIQRRDMHTKLLPQDDHRETGSWSRTCNRHLVQNTVRNPVAERADGGYRNVLVCLA